MSNDHYTYRVMWSEDDQEYVGLCAEFPGLSWLDTSSEKSLTGIRKVVSEAISDMKKSGEVIPQPVTSKNYSGKFMVRVPPDVHRRLAVEAAEAGVSLNRMASAKLTR